MNQPFPGMPDLSQMMASQQPPVTNTPPSAPSGGATIPTPPVAPQQPSGLGFTPPPAQPPAPTPQQSYIAELESKGLLPPGHQFKSERDLIDRFYAVTEQMAAEMEALKGQQPAAPPAAPPVAPAAPVEDLTKMATQFQQSGWLALENGTWVAKHNAAQSMAQQLNQQIVEAQARQAELADPASFIRKYGSAAFEEMMKPLKAELDLIKQRNQMLEQQLEKTIPKPHEAWVKQNEAVLWTTDPSGQRTPSVAGKAYSEAWDMAAKYNMAVEDVHKFAMTAAAPYMQQTQQQPAQPQQSWMQQTLQNPPAANPAFNAPGTVLTQTVPPQQRDAILGPDGFPDFNRMMALPR